MEKPFTRRCLKRRWSRCLNTCTEPLGSGLGQQIFQAPSVDSYGSHGGARCIHANRVNHQRSGVQGLLQSLFRHFAAGFTAKPLDAKFATLEKEGLAINSVRTLRYGSSLDFGLFAL